MVDVPGHGRVVNENATLTTVVEPVDDLGEQASCGRARQRNTPCRDCPWQRSATPGQFTVERYVSLIPTAQQGFSAIFACHMTPEGGEVACAGYLAVAGATSLRVRFGVVEGAFDLGAIDRAVEDGEFPEMYGSFAAMAEANGVDRSFLVDPDLWTGRGPLAD